MASTKENSLISDLDWFALRGSSDDIERAREFLRKAIRDVNDEDIRLASISQDVSEIWYRRWSYGLGREDLRRLLTEMPNLKLKGVAWIGHTYEEVYSRAGSPDWVSVQFLKDYPSDELPTYKWWDKDDFFELARNADGTLRIAGFHRWDAELEIPSEIDGVAVTAIGDRAFYRNAHIRRLAIPDSVTTVGKSAFSGCANLVVQTTNQQLFQTLEKAGVSVVTGLESAADLEAKADYTYLKREGGIAITTYRGKDQEVVIPETIDGQPVVEIGDNAFNRSYPGDRQITKVSIPASVATIGARAFFCPSLAEVNFAQGSRLESIGEGAFTSCNIAQLALPDGLREIGDRAFHNCHPLASVRIPSSVSRIGCEAFGCNPSSAWRRSLLTEGWEPAMFSLERIDVDEDNEHYTSSGGVLLTKDLKGIIRVPVPAAGTYVVPDGVIKIDVAAFEGCHIEEVEIPASVRAIGKRAFASCRKLEKVTFAEGSTLEELGALAFSDCERLESFVIPASTRRLEYGALGECSSLKEVIVEPGSKLESIAEHAFAGCKALESVDLSAAEGLTAVAESAFLDKYGTYALRYVKFPASVATFEKWFGDDMSSRTKKHGVDFFAPGLACSAIKARNYKMNGVAGFVRGLMEGGEASPQIVKGYRTYVNGHAEETLERFEFDRDVLQWLLEQKWLTSQTANNVVQVAVEKGLTEQAAILLEYCNAISPRKDSSSVLSLEEKPRKRAAKKSVPENVEPLVSEWLAKVRVIPECKKTITSGVRLSSGEGACSPEALQLLVTLCYVPRSVARDPFQEWGATCEYLAYLESPEYWEKIGQGRRLHGGDNELEYKGSLFEKLTKLSGTASTIAEIASWLDPEALSEALEHIFYEDHVASALVALCRFGNESVIQRVVGDMPKWEVSKTLRKDFYIAGCALLHSRTAAAIKFCDSKDMLFDYAWIHDTTELALRRSYLS